MPRARGVLPLAAFLVALLPAVEAMAAEITIVKAGRLLDVQTGRVARDVRIRVEGSTIAAVGADIPIPSGARVVDLSAAMVLPGLIDSHTHVCLEPEDAQRSPVLYKTHASRAVHGVKAAQEALNAGFTTLRDLDNEGADMADIAVRDAIRDGVFPGPRLFVAGWALSITAGHMNVTGLSPSVDRRVDQLAIMTDGPEAMVRAVREQANAASVSPAWLQLAIALDLVRTVPGPAKSGSVLALPSGVLACWTCSRWRDLSSWSSGGRGLHNVSSST